MASTPACKSARSSSEESFTAILGLTDVREYGDAGPPAEPKDERDASLLCVDRPVDRGTRFSCQSSGIKPEPAESSEEMSKSASAVSSWLKTLAGSLSTWAAMLESGDAADDGDAAAKSSNEDPVPYWCDSDSR